MDIISYAISKKFTTDTADSLGSLKGAPCTIKSKVAIDGGTRITFSWTGISGTEQTETVDIMNGVDGQDGADGKGIKSVSVNENSHLIITYDDDTQTDAGEITVHSAVDSVNGKTGEVTLDASDVGALPDDTEIPTKTSDLTNDSNFVSDASYVHTDNNYDTTAKNIVDGVATELANKVDKVAGKGLSTNDYDNTAKTIVDGVTAALADKADTADVIDGASYDSTNHAILFKNGSTTLFSLDAAAFVKDGMIDTVSITGGNLVITFNTDAGKQDISIPISDIFDADNYYNKTTVDTLLTAKQNTLTFDNTPTASSTNPVTSGGVKTALDLKQDSLTFDNVPTENSNNPVKSGGVYSADDKIYQVMGQNSAKNFIPFDLDRVKAKNTTGTWNGNVYSVNGIDFTFNSDGTVDASGTATETASVNYYDPVGLPPFGGDRILRLTGCPSGGSGTTYKVMAYRAGEVDGSTGTAEDYGNGISLRWLNNGSGIKAFISISVYTGAGTIDVTFKPMLRLSTDTDNTFAPYAKTNQELTAANETLTNQVKDMNNILGSKNLLRQVNNGDVTSQGITFSPNDDGSITLSGTNTSSSASYYYISKGANLIAGDYEGAGVWLPKGNYIVSGGVETQNGDLQVMDFTEHTTTSIVGAVVGDTPFTLTKDTLVGVRIRVNANKTASGTAYPMIRLASIQDSTYEPYAKTNQQLTEDTTGLLDNLEVNGAVNILPIDLNYIKANNSASSWSGNACTHNGVTYTIDEANGKITVNGTASARSTLQVYAAIAGDLFKKSFKYLAKVFNNNFNTVNGYYVQLYMTNSPYTRIDAFTGNNFVVPDSFFDNSVRVSIQIVVEDGKSVDNQVITPLIAFGNYTGGFEKYAKSNKELTEDVADLSERINMLRVYHSGGFKNSAKTISFSSSCRFILLGTQSTPGNNYDTYLVGVGVTNDVANIHEIFKGSAITVDSSVAGQITITNSGGGTFAFDVIVLNNGKLTIS